MSEKLKTITINATMAIAYYLDLTVPESATADQVWDFIYGEGIVDADMIEDEDSSDWIWGSLDMGTPDLDCYFDPEAKDISKYFLASLPEEDDQDL